MTLPLPQHAGIARRILESFRGLGQFGHAFQHGDDSSVVGSALRLRPSRVEEHFLGHVEVGNADDETAGQANVDRPAEPFHARNHGAVTAGRQGERV